uniref:Secreted protein n=1 Tax=Anopheles funestus TaxID=62324 RepID=A0A182S0U8_ANOFN
MYIAYFHLILFNMAKNAFCSSSGLCLPIVIYENKTHITDVYRNPFTFAISNRLIELTCRFVSICGKNQGNLIRILWTHLVTCFDIVRGRNKCLHIL